MQMQFLQSYKHTDVGMTHPTTMSDSMSCAPFTLGKASPAGAFSSLFCPRIKSGPERRRKSQSVMPSDGAIPAVGRRISRQKYDRTWVAPSSRLPNSRPPKLPRTVKPEFNLRTLACCDATRIAVGNSMTLLGRGDVFQGTCSCREIRKTAPLAVVAVARGLDGFGEFGLTEG